jgi:putative hydrolase of the HAD superfamily
MEKHFLFDMGNVLLDFDVDVAIRYVMEAGGGAVLPAGLRLQDTVQVVEVETGKISDEEYLAHICAVTGLELTMEHLIGVWQKTFHPNPDGMALFDALREQGRKVHILSNLAHHNMVAVSRNWPDLFECTHQNFFSYEIGYHKPDERIYRAVLGRLDTAPENCFFLDDRPENVEGARALGIEAHVFNAANLPSVHKALASFCA